VVEDVEDESIPALARGRADTVGGTAPGRRREAIATLAGELIAWHKSNQASQRLATVPGIGILTATAIAATVPDASAFKSGREFAAWIGLTPRQQSSGGKERLGRISKQGNRYIRRLLVIGATVLRYARSKATAGAEWVKNLLSRRSARVVTVAMANKTARIAWALLAKNERYRPTKA
jgi:transposase